MMLASIVLLTSKVEANSDKSIKITFNEEDMERAKNPMNVSETTLVPFRLLFEAMGSIGTASS